MIVFHCGGSVGFERQPTAESSEVRRGIVNQGLEVFHETQATRVIRGNGFDVLCDVHTRRSDACPVEKILIADGS